MKSDKRPISAPILILLSFAILLGNSPQVHPSSKRIEDPSFWISNIKNPDRLLMTLSEIREMNEENLKKQDLLLCRVKDLREEWTREEIRTFLKEDWEGFGKTGEIRYGRDGIPLSDPFWNELRKNMNQDTLKERNQLLFGMTIQRTDLRVFPTEEASLSAPAGQEFDRFQHSAIAPGSLVGIYCFSCDQLWAYAQTSFMRGWIRTRDLAIAKEKSEAVGQQPLKEPLLITGNFVAIFADPLFRQPSFSAQMGTPFPILHLPQQTKTAKPSYVIKIPFRESDGRLTFRNGYIPADEDVHYGFLPYTQKNLAQQAFKMLHQPYGWGEMSGGRDCSRFIIDLFNAFGILMPRNSNLQAKMGIPLGVLEGKTIGERKRILDRAVPLATLLRMPGHIMLYLGKDKEKHYVIHSIWGFQKEAKSGLFYQKIGKVVVTDLNLGKEGLNGSLLQRLTGIQFIAPSSETRFRSQ